MNWKSGAIAAALMLAVAPGCSGSDDSANNGTNNDTTNNANNGKGDTPDVERLEACELRQADILQTGKPRFLEDFVRWPCGDVEGVNTNGRDDRGQEYCEYFAVVQVPDEFGENLEERGQIFGIPGDTPLAPELNDDQLFLLEDMADDVVGSCVFTSWHKDIPGPVPACDSGTCPDVLGNEITEEFFRMRIGFNSNAAASDLVQQCLRRVESTNYGESLGFENEFIRGCMLVADIFGTEWRASDPQICAAAMRLGECGCGVAGAPDADLGFAMVPPLSAQREQAGEDAVTFRGFELGTWDNPEGLPTGCSYVDIGVEDSGEPSKTMVTCDITGNDLIQNAADPKGFCRAKYGDDVVLHVPVPARALECNPPAEGIFSHTCEAQPWVVNASPPADEPIECCRVCTIGKACGDTCIDASESCTAEPGCACDG